MRGVQNIHDFLPKPKHGFGLCSELKVRAHRTHTSIRNSASELNPLPSLYRQGLPASLFGAPHRLPRALSSPNSRKMPLRLDIKAEGGDEPLAVDYTFSSSIADHLRAASLVIVMQCQGAYSRLCGLVSP
ncbi:uncharacterized protein LOC126602702 [Malus sylvestris]|uniref:uncharacterized protein LOC126602702 n=1 Tax=Malus sylvestris TaxID=3752 RepID=UPI0021AC330F|nr:uncharacterized protein LOC126602702 [Malus sylvestris]